jgi:hypothetical protein
VVGSQDRKDPSSCRGVAAAMAMARQEQSANTERPEALAYLVRLASYASL